MFEKNLKYYRLRTGMTKKALADKCGITPMSITHYEKGDRKPDMATIKKLADALGIRVSDFLAVRNSELNFAHGEFRKTSSLKASVQEYIVEYVEDYCSRFYNAVDCISGFPLPQAINCHSVVPSGDYEKDGIALRLALGFPETGPIQDLIAVLENNGIIIIEMDIDNEHFSGMNGMVNEYPYIVINKNMSAERQRSTIAHELTHMMFVNDEDDFGGMGAEKFATAVSGAFLITRRDLERELGIKRSHVTMDMLLICKEYGVSMMLLVKRAEQVGIISASVAKDFYIRAGKAGWRKNEPSRIEADYPTLFRQLVCRAINEDGMSLQKGAELLRVPYTEMVENCSLMEV